MTTNLDIAPNWRSLRHKITSEKQSDKKVFTGEEITFQVPLHRFDSQIPILKEYELCTWLAKRETRQQASSSQAQHEQHCPTHSATKPSEPSRQTTTTPKRATTPIPPPSPVATPRKLKPTDFRPNIQPSRQSTPEPVKTSTHRDLRPDLQPPRQSTPALAPKISPKSAPTQTTSESSIELSPIYKKKSISRQNSRSFIDPDGPKRQHKSKDSSRTDTDHQASCNNQPPSTNFQDTLVIHEDYEDEFAKYIDDDDDVETEISKNKKKIQTKAPPKVVPPPPPPPPPQQTKQRPKPAPPKKSTLPSKPIQPDPIVPDEPMEVDQQQPEPKISQPDWQDTQKQLQDGKLMTVLKDLVHFKDKITSDEVKSIPKTLILKCILEDDMVVLPDSLDLIIELDCFWEDCEFWSEMIMRFKRKLSQHCKIYRNQRDPIETRRQYELLMKKLSAYVDKRNITCKIPVDAMKLLLSFAEEKVINKTNGQDIKANVKKEQVTVPIMNPILRKTLSECKKENIEVKPGFDGNREIKPNLLPNGRISFKIRKPRNINNGT